MILDDDKGYINIFLVPSVIISLNQSIIPKTVKVKPKLINCPPWLKPCIYITAPKVKLNNEKLTKIGHGEGSTKWKGKDWNWFLFILFIIFCFYLLF